MSKAFELPGYAVFSGDLHAQFPAWLRERYYSQIFLLTDTRTRGFCLPVFLEKTGLPEHLPGYTIPAGEAHKTLATCEQVWQAMFAAGLDRKALAVQLGGGVVGDLGGFCAATYKRGIDFVQVPTTLLSMTDAAIGGKLGIDFQGIKNAVGVFQNPAAVFADPDFLQTLSRRELRSGFAEVIKHALIGDPDLLDELSGFPLSENWNLNNSRDIQPILSASIAVKVRIVTEDPLEKGLRALLNFGHTVGHAVESFFLDSTAPLTHGEAVAIGMICESWLAWGDSPRSTEIARLISRFFPQHNIPEEIFPDLWQLMQQDKKNTAGAVRIAVPMAGQPFALQVLEPTREAVAASLRYYHAITT